MAADSAQNDLQIQLCNYKESVRRNLKDSINSGEFILLGKLLKMLGKPQFQQFTVYYQVKYDFNSKIRGADFIIVSPKGIFLLESKHWKGVTYIYKGNLDNWLLFNNPQLKIFGKEKKGKTSLNTRVFNVRERKGQVCLYSFGKNPVEQVREYSSDLASHLKSDSDFVRMRNAFVRNAVVFTNRDNCEIFYNNVPLTIERLDGCTHLMTDEYIEDFFSTIPPMECDMQKAINEIDKLNHRAKIDKDNYRQPPFDLIEPNHITLEGSH